MATIKCLYRGVISAAAGAYGETDLERADPDAVIMEMLEGQDQNPRGLQRRRKMVRGRLRRRSPLTAPDAAICNSETCRSI
jgi:hypothetical protein